MDKKQVYKLIRNFEFEMGEDFIDQNENIVNEKCLMFWMLGKGYISGNNVDSYCEPNNKFIDLNDLLCGSEQDYALFPNGRCDEDCHFKAMEILAELISEVKTYQDRLLNIVTEYDIHTLADDRDKYLEEEYERALSLSINELNDKMEKECQDNDD